MIYKRGCDKKGPNRACSKCGERGSCGVYECTSSCGTASLFVSLPRQGSDKVARQMESAHRVSLAKG